MDWDTDNQIRHAALEWLAETQQTNQGTEIYSSQTKFLVPGIGEIRAISPQNGIWKPRQMQACLSVRTSHNPVYKDIFLEVEGLLAYKYRTHGGYNHSDNRSLRTAIEFKLPLLYFVGVDRGVYDVEVVRVLRETDKKNGVLLDFISVEEGLNLLSVNSSGSPQLVMEQDSPQVSYRTSVFKQRVHQSKFRRQVILAYDGQCTICHLRHKSLLDAAHIIPDAKGGKPEVTNGLSLCRIHHGAYDQNILGIDHEYRVHINQKMLKERDGPMLQYGFQEMNERNIILPRNLKDHPDKGKLAERFSEFQNTH